MSTDERAPSEQARRRLVAESWARAQAADLTPDRVEVTASLAAEEVDLLRRAHPLAATMPVIRSLLARETADDTGLVLAVADTDGRVLWVEGGRRELGLAEALRVVPGADWSETGAGTNAPGTALTLDRRVQIVGDEHFAVQAQELSCTAVPIHDLATMETIGVLDITGGPAAVGARSLPLLAATAAAAERELLIGRARRGERTHQPTRAMPAQLSVLGRGRAVLLADGRSTALSLRHAELLTLLAWHRGGLTAERLAELVHDRPDPAAVRPEMTRLRRLLAGVAPSLVPLARPYRMPGAIELDARRLVTQLDRGAHRAALDGYGGPVLPTSIAPGIVEIRAEVDARLREALLQNASPELLMLYADLVAPTDSEPLRTALQMLPLRSPKRAGIVARLEAMV